MSDGANTLPSATSLSLKGLLIITNLYSSSYTPLVIAIQQMLEYDNNNRLPDVKVSYSLKTLFYLYII
jgi:hypothetical protein